LVSSFRYWTTPSLPTGITMRPPFFSCATRAGGTLGAAAVTTIASNGAFSGQPA